MKDFVLIKDLGIYGNVINSWNVTNNGLKEKNYIIKDLNGIEHERLISEIEFVDNVEDSIKKGKCNLPLEKLIELFNKIDRKYTLFIESSMKKENCHSDVYVPYVCVKYGTEDKVAVIKNGELYLMDIDSIPEKDEYECCIWYYDTDIKDTLFELYMNIILRLKKD